MKDKETIHLYNRYDELVYLEHLSGNDWELKGSQFAFQHLGITFDNVDGVEKIYAVDPPGGPFLSVGLTLDSNHKRIANIRSDNNSYILTLENIDETN